MYFSKAFMEMNIGSGQYLFLLFLYRNDGVTQDYISKSLRIDKATTARALKKLESLDYIRREVDEQDKRAHRVYVTQKALENKEKFFSILSGWSSKIGDGFSEEEKEVALGFLERMIENAKKEKGE